jgi:hypothetical protein
VAQMTRPQERSWEPGEQAILSLFNKKDIPVVIVRRGRLSRTGVRWMWIRADRESEPFQVVEFHLKKHA